MGSERILERVFPRHVSIQRSREHIHRSPWKRNKKGSLFGACFCSSLNRAIASKHDKNIKRLPACLRKKALHFSCFATPDLRLSNTRMREDTEHLLLRFQIAASA